MRDLNGIGYVTNLYTYFVGDIYMYRANYYEEYTFRCII